MAEARGEVGDPNYLGAIAISGVAEAQEIFERLARGPGHRMLVFLAQGIKAVFPDFRVEEMLSEKAIPLYQFISHACEASLGPFPNASPGSRLPRGVTRVGRKCNMDAGFSS